jgi:hypothetical protein
MLNATARLAIRIHNFPDFALRQSTSTKPYITHH